MGVVWLAGAVYSAIVVALSSNNAFNVFSSSSDQVQWTVSSEDYVLSISNLLIVIVALILVTASYVAIIVYLWRKQTQSGQCPSRPKRLQGWRMPTSPHSRVCVSTSSPS